MRTVAAASILAKVHRDALLASMHERYPGYGFAEHRAMRLRSISKRFGGSVRARSTAKGSCGSEIRCRYSGCMVRETGRNGRPQATGVGKDAEDAAAAYLAAVGMRVLARNVRGPGGETTSSPPTARRSSSSRSKRGRTARSARPWARVDARKRRRIRATAEEYLQFVAPLARGRFDVVTVEPSGVTLHRNAFGWP